jgi:hypothetical protein
MFSRSLKLGAVAVSPLGWCLLAGCASGTPSPPTNAGSDAGVSQDGGSPEDVGLKQDVGSPQDSESAVSESGPDAQLQDAESGVASSDSGIVPDDAPAGCPSNGADADAGPVGPPVGRLLAAGNALSARGVTSDGYEIFSDDAALALYAVPIAGGNRQSIVALGSKFWVTVVGQVVFAWSSVTDANVGALTVWSSSRGSHAVSSASFGILGTSSADGSQILYVANVDGSGLTGDVYVAGTDGSGATSLLKGQQLTGCFPQLGFVGSYAVASHCDVPREAGPSTTISSFRSPSWTRADIIGDAANIWSADTGGTMVLASTSSGISVVPIGGGAGTTIDPQGFLGQMIAGGKTAIYSTMTGTLRSSPTTAPSPATLASSFGGFYSVSPDQNQVLYYANSTSTGTDIDLASTVTPGTAHALSAATTGTVNGDAFTADSTYALYSTSNDVCTGSAAFNAFPVSGSAPILLGHNVWGDWSATGSKVIFNDNYMATGGLRFGRADIESVNLATGTTPTRVVSQADAVINLTPAKDQMIYSWSVQPGALAGLYVTPVP